jgi:hypothetical protein
MASSTDWEAYAQELARARAEAEAKINAQASKART